MNRGWLQQLVPGHYWCVTGMHPLSCPACCCYRLGSTACHKGMRHCLVQKQSSTRPWLCGWHHSTERNCNDLQNLVISISDRAAGLGLPINAKRTKNMLSGNHPHDTDVCINENKIENMEGFTYLESSIHHPGVMDHDLKCRVWWSINILHSAGENVAQKEISPEDQTLLL